MSCGALDDQMVLIGMMELKTAWGSETRVRVIKFKNHLHILTLWTPWPFLFFHTAALIPDLCLFSGIWIHSHRLWNTSHSAPLGHTIQRPQVKSYRRLNGKTYASCWLAAFQTPDSDWHTHTLSPSLQHHVRHSLARCWWKCWRNGNLRITQGWNESQGVLIRLCNNED